MKRTDQSILVIGLSTDLLLKRVLESANDMGVRAFLIDEAAHPLPHLTWRSGEQRLVVGKERGSTTFDLETPRSILNRSVGLVNAGVGTSNGNYLTAEWRAFLVAVFNSDHLVVVNRPPPHLWHHAWLRPMQIRTVLPSLRSWLGEQWIISDPELLIEVTSAGPCAITPITGHERFVVSEDIDRALSLLEHFPVVVSEYANGRTATLTIVGSDWVWDADDHQLAESFASAIRSGGVTEYLSEIGIVFYQFILRERADGDGWQLEDIYLQPKLVGEPETDARIVRACLGLLVS